MRRALGRAGESEGFLEPIHLVVQEHGMWRVRLSVPSTLHPHLVVQEHGMWRVRSFVTRALQDFTRYCIF